jgi:hypothetical protein
MKVSSLHLVAFAIQGKSTEFLKWVETFNQMISFNAIHLFYLSYDNDISPETCVTFKNSTCIYGPHTSWTEGRNALVYSVAKYEKHFNFNFKYLVFSDSDLFDSTCPNEKCENSSCCFDKFVNILLSPVDFATIGFAGYRPPGSSPLIHRTDEMVLHEDCQDAMMQAIHHKAVPILLPYIEILDSVSWWESQLLLFQTSATCLRGHSVILPFFNCENNVHKNYPRGKFRDMEKVVIEKIYYQYELIDNKDEKNMNNDVDNNKKSYLNFNYAELDLGDCGNHKIGWKNLSLETTIQESGHWLYTNEYKKCFHALHHRYAQFIELPSPTMLKTLDGTFLDIIYLLSNVKDGHVIMSTNAREKSIFLLKNGTKHVIPDFDTFSSMGFHYSQIVKLPHHFISQIPTHPQILPHID